jgi:hypothetical protein
MDANFSIAAGQAIPSFGYAPRFLLGVWCLCAMVFIYVYVGILVSFLSIPKLRPLVDSLEDLPTSGLDWGVKQGTAQLTIFTVQFFYIHFILGFSLTLRLAGSQRRYFPYNWRKVSAESVSFG